MSFAMMKYLIFCIVLLTTYPFQTVAADIPIVGCLTFKVQVHVVNNLPPNSNLRLHCASGDDDLGFHNITVNYDFKWKFCNSFWGDTLFFCNLWWGNKSVGFDAYKNGGKPNCFHDLNVGGIYYWAVKSDGIYSSCDIPPKALTKMYDWK
ncbi:hypothetical protein ACP275_06G188000 [Erythranthe tilingii]